MPSRPKGISDAYVYDSTTSPDPEWRALNERLPGMRLFANTSLPGKAEAGGFAGLYTYDVRTYDGTSFSADLRNREGARPALRPVRRPRFRRSARHRRSPSSGSGRTERPTTTCGVARCEPPPPS